MKSAPILFSKGLFKLTFRSALMKIAHVELLGTLKAHLLRAISTQNSI